MLASLGACATVDSQRHGFAAASVAESSPPRWGFAATAEPSRLMHRGFATLSEPPQQPERWGFVELPTGPSTLQASRVSGPAGARR